LVKKEGLDKEILESRNRLFSDLYGKWWYKIEIFVSNILW
jgi:hypothetical protein